MRKRSYSRRRSPMAQKPWNKVQRMEKFWTLTQDTVNFQVTEIGSGTSAAGYAVAADGNKLTSDQFVTNQPRALQHCKVHRIQGHVYAWLRLQANGAVTNGFRRQAANSDQLNAALGDNNLLRVYEGELPPPNMCMLSYVWYKQKDKANTPNDDALVAIGDFNPHPTQDLPNILLRDDIMGWGSVPCFGATPMMFNFGSGSTLLNRMLITNPGQYTHNQVCKIPLPRIPKAGLNLRQGEQLVCAVSPWAGPCGQDNNGVEDEDNIRTVEIFSQLRWLCSI